MTLFRTIIDYKGNDHHAHPIWQAVPMVPTSCQDRSLFRALRASVPSSSGGTMDFFPINGSFCLENMGIIEARGM